MLMASISHTSCNSYGRPLCNRTTNRPLYFASSFFQTLSAVYAPIFSKLPHDVQGGQKIGTIFLYALTSSNINRFSKFFHCQNQEKISNNTITKDPTTAQVCRYTTLCPIKAPPRGVLPSRPRPAFKTQTFHKVV